MYHGPNPAEEQNPCADLLTSAPGGGVPFHRMFPELEPANHDPSALKALADSTIPEENSPPTPQLTNVLSGIVFLGQFIDHDITFQANTPTDIAGPHPIAGDPPAMDEEGNEIPPGPPVVNCRDPLLNLDVVYGAGPDDPKSAILYENRYFKLTENGDIVRDGPQIGGRMIGGNPDTRLIADPRNDENVLVLQVHTLFMRLHNVVLRELAADPEAPTKAEFTEAKRKIVEAFRHIVLFEYVTALCDDPNLPTWVKNQAHAQRFLGMRDGEGIPLSIEFAAAAFRFQHSQVRGGYRLNKIGGEINGRGLFNNSGSDLRGNQPIVDEIRMDFAFFFQQANSISPETPPTDGDKNRAMAIDDKLSRPLSNLPASAIGGPPVSLPERNLLRGLAFKLPSGQAIAEVIKAEGQPGTKKKNEDGMPVDRTLAVVETDVDPCEGDDLKTSTPLWFYVMKEAEILNGGEKLGPVGSRIIAEVFVGLLLSDGLPYPGQENPPALGTSFGALVNYVQDRNG